MNIGDKVEVSFTGTLQGINEDVVTNSILYHVLLRDSKGGYISSIHVPKDNIVRSERDGV